MLEITPNTNFVRKQKEETQTCTCKLKEAAIKLRKAQNALAKCKQAYVRRQLAIDVVKLQNSFDKMIGLKS
ncbi:hypothetical protein WAF17_21000 [Bernardetia sp. ABR2-2B]|uniref:hypothetical protein n=1 Tax=Bernardetia sp. ABR2-2B TaxID=3127472 RepID=UPI0030CC43DA